ncbi:GAF domain-containing protein [Cupriavidus basilensis]
MTALTLTQLPVPASGTHGQRIARAVASPQSATDASAAVVRSWARCLGEYGLDPERRPVPPVLSASELRERGERFGDLADCARLEMTTLYQQLADPDMAVMLTDADGVVMHLVAADPFAREIAPEGLRVGAIWSEREAGTNGMGTCLAEAGAVAIRQHEHFFQRYTGLTCSAAPIFDENGAAGGGARRHQPLAPAVAATFPGAGRHVVPPYREPPVRCPLPARVSDPLPQPAGTGLHRRRRQARGRRRRRGARRQPQRPAPARLPFDAGIARKAHRHAVHELARRTGGT